MVGNRTKDGSYETSKELYANSEGRPEIVAYDGGTVCPPFCGAGGKGKSTLIVRNDNSMEVI
jgi:hypothetical protein